MKTTVKTRNGRAVVVPSTVTGEVSLCVTSWTGAMSAVSLTPDEAGALIFGLEQALETLAQYQAQRQAVAA